MRILFVNNDGGGFADYVNVPSAAFGRNQNCISRKKRKNAQKGEAETAPFLVFFASFFVFCGPILLSFFRSFLSKKQEVTPL